MDKTGRERLLMVVGLSMVLILAWFKPLEIAAENQVDAGFNRAIASYALARTLNAVISVAQGTEVAIEPGGVGVVLAPGQILDPINDLVEQFSDLMLAALVAFGVMKVSLSIGSFWFFSLLLSAGAAGWVWMRWVGRTPPALFSKIIFLLLFVRFIVPLVIVGSNFVFQEFLAKNYTENQNAIESGTGQLETLSAQEEATESKTDTAATTSPTPADTQEHASAKPAGSPAGAKVGFLDKIWNSLSEAKDKAGAKLGQIGQTLKQQVNVQGRLENIKKLTSSLVEHIVSIIVVFLLQTLVVPLVLFWIFYKLGRLALDSIKVPETAAREL